MAGRLERELLRAIRQGRPAACEMLIDEHYGSIYRFVLYLSSDADLAEELTHETFACAWLNIGSFQGQASLATWLHRIAYSKFIDVGRRRQRRAALMSSLKAQGNVTEPALDPLEQLATDEDIRILYEGIERLDASDRTMIVLHYIQGLSFRQVAGVLDVPVGTAKWQTSRALKKLRAYLTGRV